ncbi:MAG: Spy/CpxP family protein refolding chaperone [Bacteroidota bacterium]
MNRRPVFRSALLLLAALTVTTTAAFAQGRSSADREARQGIDREARQSMDREARLDQLADHLELTDAQRSDLQPILEAHKTAMRAIHDDAKTLRDRVQSGDLTREEAQAQRSAFDARIQAERAAFAEAAQPILTAEQQAKLAQMQAKRGDRPRGERRRGQRSNDRSGDGSVQLDEGQ